MTPFPTEPFEHGFPELTDSAPAVLSSGSSPCLRGRPCSGSSQERRGRPRQKPLGEVFQVCVWVTAVFTILSLGPTSSLFMYFLQSGVC